MDGDLKLAAGLCEQFWCPSFRAPSRACGTTLGRWICSAVSPAWLEERRADLKRLKERTSVVSAFLSQIVTSGDLIDDYPDTAWADETIGRRARYADITVIAPELLAGETLKSKAIEGDSSGKPLLLIPEGSRPTLKPKRVLVAWDARLESSRAVRESLDMLIGADEVHLVMVDPVEDEYHHGAEPGADAAAYLARHGVKVAVDRLPSSNHSVADVLRRHAVDIAADLVVMGAYGHSRLRERIFGGVTYSMLEDPSMPILMAR